MYPFSQLFPYQAGQVLHRRRSYPGDTSIMKDKPLLSLLPDTSDLPERGLYLSLASEIPVVRNAESVRFVTDMLHKLQCL